MKSNEMMKSLMKFVKKDCYKGQLISAFSFTPSINMHIIFWILYNNISDYLCAEYFINNYLKIYKYFTIK